MSLIFECQVGHWSGLSSALFCPNNGVAMNNRFKHVAHDLQLKQLTTMLLSVATLPFLSGTVDITNFVEYFANG